MNEWVQGDDINDFFSYLQTTDYRDDLVFSTSYVYESARRRARSGDTDRLRRLLPDLHGKKLWILPLHFGFHWTLCAIDLKAMIMFFYEPTAGEKDRWESFSDDISEAAMIIRELLLYVDPGPWLTSMACYSTPQNDGVSCGVYVMLTGQILHEIHGIPDFISVHSLAKQKSRIWSEMNRAGSILRKKCSASQKGLDWIEIDPGQRTDDVVRDPLMELCGEIPIFSIDKKLELASLVLRAKRDCYPFGLSKDYRYFILEDDDHEEDDGLWAAQNIPSANYVWINSQSSIFHNLVFEIEFLHDLLQKGVKSATICLSGFFNETKKSLGIVHSEDYHIFHQIYKGRDAGLKILVNDVIFSFANYFPADFLTVILAKDLREARKIRKKEEKEFLDILITRDYEEREDEDVFIELFEHRTRESIFCEKEDQVFEKGERKKKIK